MSTRRSSRVKKEVKYTSDSDGSDFSPSKPRKAALKAAVITPKKRRTEAAAADTPTAKRPKKSPASKANELRKKAEEQDAKAAKQKSKAAWESWVSANDAGGKLLDGEPDKEEAITQTDCLKKYGLKKEELGPVLHFEKKNPLYGGTMRLFLEEDVKQLAIRKFGMLAGATNDNEMILEGEKVWQEKLSNGELATPEKKPTDNTTKTTEPKTPKQKWAAFVKAHTLANPDSLTSEPEEPINQTDCKTNYNLTPGDLSAIPYFPKPNQKYGNTTKLFRAGQVRELARRKEQILAEE